MSQQEAFEAAVVKSKQLTKRPDNETLLQLYSLYKQATEGDMDPNTPAPGMFDFVNKAKYDAWSKLRGLPSGDAMDQYIGLVDELKGA